MLCLKAKPSFVMPKSNLLSDFSLLKQLQSTKTDLFDMEVWQALLKTMPNKLRTGEPEAVQEEMQTSQYAGKVYIVAR